mmetsp:Transcript_6781/g.18722  ORF Transcript_6781/g.18722 Transcript_6781/m.18722 type:complete len:251 (+) Transcript_6781:335-1087(+)
MVPSELKSLIPDDLGEAVLLCGIKGLLLRRKSLYGSAELLVGHGHQEEVGELVLRLIHDTDQLHAEVLGVKFHSCLAVLHSQHGLREVLVFRPAQWLAPADLDPVAVRVQGESQPLHAALIRLLLELHACRFKHLAGLVNVVDIEGYVPEAPRGGLLRKVGALAGVPACVAIPDLETVIHLSAVVVRELDGGAIHVEEVLLALQRGLLKRTLRAHLHLSLPLQEIHCELKFIKADPVNELHPEVLFVEGN